MKALLFLPLMSLAVAAEPFEVSLVQVQVGKPLAGEIPFEVKPMGYEPGVRLDFLVSGENLVAIKDKSVDVKSFKLGDGREWSRTRSGKANWEQESFSKVSEDGKLGRFGISFPGDLFGSLEAAALDASVTVITASKPEEKKIELTDGDKTQHELGPFEISSGQGAGFFGGGADKGSSVTVTGNPDAVIEITVKDGDTELDSNSTSTVNKAKTYHFEKAKGDKLSVTVRYWTDLKEEVVPVKMEPAKK
ncbi:hypothetical protein OKA04_17135 [Luteolibacter flavescens]|uniref:Uncharacterized protein n=1 Tax=Luteolibacter flavescens TaxID=1859460 RepID=A0ABT3FSA4_9BACT|nr:hypothetical protein [Luteolibacter flavescens]MCW1886466.1 hypothetical protein [Luteolibacter flavescens]